MYLPPELRRKVYAGFGESEYKKLRALGWSGNAEAMRRAEQLAAIVRTRRGSHSRKHGLWQGPLTRSEQENLNSYGDNSNVHRNFRKYKRFEHGFMYVPRRFNTNNPRDRPRRSESPTRERRRLFSYGATSFIPNSLRGRTFANAESNPGVIAKLRGRYYESRRVTGVASPYYWFPTSDRSLTRGGVPLYA